MLALGKISPQNDHAGEFPLKNPYQAFEVMRTYQLGRLKSIEYKPDRIQTSISREVETWIHLDGTAVTLDLGNKRDALFLSSLFAYKQLLAQYTGDDDRPKAFTWYYIGTSDPESDTGDSITLPVAKIAKELGRPSRTVYNWVNDLLGEFTRILVSRNLLSPEFLD